MPYSNGACVELTRESCALEERLKPITAELNEKPLRVNKFTWLKNLEAAEENAHFLVDYCRHLADDDNFRPNSPADCIRALFTAKGREPKKISESGRPSCDKDTLAELANEGDSLAGAIIDARSAISRWGQLKAWAPFADVGYVLSFWDSLGTPHGRYTSDGPCLNNRIEPIRETIEPNPGYTFLSLDFSQAEYVCWASLSKDLVLSTAFLQGKDFHVEIAQAIRSLVPTWDLRGQDERAAGKTLNFAILYQMKPHTLARKLGCSVEIAAKIIKAFYARAPRASAYIDHTLAIAEELGFAETHYGRRRYCPEYQSPIAKREDHEIEKTLWNHVVAGTAAEVLKWKQVKVWEFLRHIGYMPNQVRLCLQMFDELIFAVEDTVIEEVCDLAEGIMRTPEPGFLPFKVGVKLGKTWRECSK